MILGLSSNVQSSCKDEDFLCPPYRSDVYTYSIVFCRYIISSTGFTSLFMLVYTPISIEAQFCTLAFRSPWSTFRILSQLTFWGNTKCKTYFDTSSGRGHKTFWTRNPLLFHFFPGNPYLKYL